MVSREGNDVVIDDAGAAIRPQRGCTVVTANRVRCERTEGLYVWLGDGNDRATVDDNVQVAADYVSLDGEQGDDELTGSAANNALDGGPGRDTLRGGSGTGSYFAVDLLGIGPYTGPPRVRVEADRVVCAAPASGRPFVQADRLDMLEGPCSQPEVLSDPKATSVRKRPGRCRRSSTSRGARRIVRTRQGVVFTKRSNYYACLYSQGRISRLFDEGTGVNGRPKPVMKGRYLAYTSRGSGVGDEIDRVIVWDLWQGRLKMKATSTFVTRIALKKNGSVAWTAGSDVATVDANRPLVEVRQMSAVDRQGDVLVDRGADVDAASLRIARDGRTISWRRGGETRSAALR